MSLRIEKATKQKTKGRITLCGPSGSGKTYTALRMSAAMAGPQGRVLLIDSEHNSASKYFGDPNPDGGKFNFDRIVLDDFSPTTYVEAIHLAEQGGYDVIVIDSISHAWMWKGGALEQVDRIAKKTGNSYTAWGEVTPKHIEFIETMLRCQCHLITTMRVKTEYVLEPNQKGKQAPRKIGLAPVQRDGMEYEFDVVADLDLDHTLKIGKTRCSALDGKVFESPGKNVAEPFMAWLSDGTDAPPPITPAEPQPAAVPPATTPPASRTAAVAQKIAGNNGGSGQSAAQKMAGEMPALVKRLLELGAAEKGEKPGKFFCRIASEALGRKVTEPKISEIDLARVHGKMKSMVLAREAAAKAPAPVETELALTVEEDPPQEGKEPEEQAKDRMPPPERIADAKKSGKVLMDEINAMCAYLGKETHQPAEQVYRAVLVELQIPYYPVEALLATRKDAQRVWAALDKECTEFSNTLNLV